MKLSKRLALMLSIVFLGTKTLMPVMAYQPVKTPARAADYLQVVRLYAEAMIERGRDTYGATSSPLFAATLDRQSLRLPTTQTPDIQGIRSHDRTLSGANPMHDQNLYQVLYALTKITGEPRYAKAADETLKWFFTNCQSQTTGLFAWGEHLGWDFQAEAALPGRDIHEFYRPWVLWPRTFQLAPAAAHKFARGLWQHQIGDQATGLFSRHARYSKHAPAKDADFPRHAGFYIATWAAAYEQAQQPALLKAIEVLTGAMERRRNAKSGALSAYTPYPELMWPPSTVSLAIDLHDAANKVPPPLAAKLQALAAQLDDVYLRMKHELAPQGRGFIQTARTSTLEAGDVRDEQLYQDRLFTRRWATGYGEATDAQTAMQCLLRYQQIKHERYKQLFLATAARYLNSTPDTSGTLYPAAMGEAIACLVGAYRLTGASKYLQRADFLGQAAVQIFFAGAPLPRASSRHDHYEAITRGDTLAMTLLDLWAAQHRPKLDLGLVWSDR